MVQCSLSSNHYLGYTLYRKCYSSLKTFNAKFPPALVWISSAGFSAFLETVPVWTESLWLIRRKYLRKYCDNCETWKFNCFYFVSFYRFFPVLDIFGWDRDCRMNDNFVSIMLEGVRCSKFTKVFSYLRSSADMQYKVGFFFLGSRELIFFLFCISVLLNRSCIATWCLSSKSSQIRTVWIRLQRINFKVLSKRTFSCFFLSWLSCREFTLSFCCCSCSQLFCI